MQDRINTIRVYRSVNGNMSGLDDYYCIHGLEHFLAVNQPLKTEQRFRLSGTSARTDQPGQELSYPTSLSSSKCTEWLTVNNAPFLDNAMATLQKSNEFGIPDHAFKKISVVDNDDLRSYSSTEKIVDNVDNKNTPVDRRGDVRLTSTMRKKIDFVDVKSLRKMNMELLKSMRANAESNAMNLLLKTDAALLKADALSSRSFVSMEGLGKISTPDTIPDFIQLGSTDYNATLLNVMNQALEITSNCVDCVDTFSSTR